MTGILSALTYWSDGTFRQGWERQLADGGPLVPRQRGGDRRKPPERQWHPARQGNYSGQPVPAAFGREAAKYNNSNMTRSTRTVDTLGRQSHLPALPGRPSGATQQER